ncbi:hypothetical protein MmTuc01_2758 [Methanosarcina mazei Tuc01]|uniref:Uncharacterized protein n=2 Tax=Methanosarcina mazei TaxID=2209 RepID=M1Q0E5_METMZ|nr:hypothetical protein MmTuc01_2758 [Methanosarcina mazei Tuc01]
MAPDSDIPDGNYRQGKRRRFTAFHAIVSLSVSLCIVYNVSFSECLF